MVPKHRRLLLLAYYYPPCNTSGVQRALRLVKYLPENGYSPFVICSSDDGVLPRESQTLHVPNAVTEAKAGRRSCMAAKFQRLFLPYNEKLAWAPHALAAAEELLLGTVAVLSTSPPLVTHMVAWQLKQRHGLKWLADFRDPLVGNPGRPRKWARLYDVGLERAILGSCDAATGVTDVIVDEWKKKYPQWAHKFHLVWNGFDPEEPAVASPIPPRRYKKLLHAGVLYHQRHPFWLVAALDRLIRRGSLDPETIRVQLIGLVQEREVFCSHPAVAALLAKGCLVCDGKLVPREVAMQETASSDYLLILDIANLSEVGYTVPAKLYDNIRIGRPILAFTPTPQSPLARILQQSGLSHTLVHTGESDEAVDSKVLGFFRLSNKPVSPSRWFLDNFDGRCQAKLMAGILDGVTNAE